MANNDAYIVSAVRTPVAKRRGAFLHVRPDDMLAHVLREVLARGPAGFANEDVKEIGDVIVGCAFPEAEQGLNVARIGLLLAGFPNTVPGLTINRFCSSGLQAVALAADRIRAGEADVMIAGGTESMTAMPQMMGNKVSVSPAVFEKDENTLELRIKDMSQKMWYMSVPRLKFHPSVIRQGEIVRVRSVELNLTTKRDVIQVKPYTNILRISSHCKIQQELWKAIEDETDTDKLLLDDSSEVLMSSVIYTEITNPAYQN